LLYHKIDMKANGGAGKVIEKAVPILENAKLSKSQMMACKHANGYDWWLLKQGANTNTVYTFLITKDTVMLDTIQTFPQPVFGYYDLYGQSCFNSNGSKYAFASGGVNSHGDKLFIADFDRCYGIISNVNSFHAPLHNTNTTLDTLYPGEKDTMITGLCFSPSDSFLYVSKSFNIYQYELTQTDSSLAWYHVQHGPDTAFRTYAQLYLGSNNRIYIGKRDGVLSTNSVIDNPNIKGIGCGFCKQCIKVDTTWYYTQSLANMPNFNMPKKEPCYPMYIGQFNTNHGWSIYPNPSNTIVYIRNQDKKRKELYNSIGQMILTTIENEIDVSRLERGVYYLKVNDEVKKVVVE